jgi:ketopantoate reductase
MQVLSRAIRPGTTFVAVDVAELLERPEALLNLDPEAHGVAQDLERIAEELEKLLFRRVVSTTRATIPDAGLSPPVSPDEALDGLNTSSEAA